jgi:hypothetical protein
MTEREERDLAHRLADGSSVFDFDRALVLVQQMPAEAERLIRMKEETLELQEERARARERMLIALREEFG